MTIEFTVPGRPVPMARPRVTVHGTYTPKECRIYKHCVASIARAAMLANDYEMFNLEPLECRVRFIFPLPKTRKNPWATSRPDLDNLYKAVTDAMNGIVYKDDAQIVKASIEKAYEINGDGRAEIWVREIA